MGLFDAYVPSGGHQGDHDCRRHDQDCLRPSERQAEHRQAYLHQWCQRRQRGI